MIGFCFGGRPILVRSRLMSEGQPTDASFATNRALAFSRSILLSFSSSWLCCHSGLSPRLLIRHGLLQSPDAVQLEPVEGLRHLSPSKVYE